jgi:hypothetical protein
LVDVGVDEKENRDLKYFFGTSELAHGVNKDGQINAPFL